MPESVIRGSLSITLKDMGLDNKDIAFSKNIIPLIRSCDFKRNYRDLEGVLRKAVRSALKDNRNEIIQKDLSFLEQPLISKMDVIKNDYEEKLKSIKLKDIVIFAKDEAEKVAKNIRSSIIENKLIEIQKTGNDIKTVLMKREGLKLTEYQVFLGHITTYTGKKWSTIKKLLN
jgi:transcriptional regulator with GAF, ATPase, and Fis domain